MSTAAVVDVPQTVADWLVTFGVLHHGKTVLNTKGEHLRQISGKDWAAVQSGLAVGAILSSFFSRLGVQEALPTLREGNDLQVGPRAPCFLGVDAQRADALPPSCHPFQVRLYNWNALMPVLARLGLVLTSDEKTLIVGGDTEELFGQLYELRTRMGLGAAAINQAAAQSIKESAQEENAEEAASNKWEVRRSTLFQVAGLYSIVVACLLSIFVSQRCGASVCTARQNLKQGTYLGTVVTGFNFASLAVFLVAQVVFYAREVWCIEAFSYDLDLPVENLAEELTLYPAFKRKLYRWNIWTLVLSTFLAALMLTNFVLSAIMLFGKRRYAGYATVIGVFSNTGLVFFKITNWCMTARKSMRTDSAILFFTSDNRSLNTVDAQYRFDPQFYKPRLDA